MERQQLVENLKNITFNKFGETNAANISKSLGFYFLKKYTDASFADEDLWNSCVDAANDRGFDFIFLDDSELPLKAYFVQCKFSENGETLVDENEVSKTIRNFDLFPDLPGSTNHKLNGVINDYKLNAKANDDPIEKVGIYINLGAFSGNASAALQHANFEVFDFERFNSEILLDPRLPDIEIELVQQPIFFDSNSILGILLVEKFLDDAYIQGLISNQKLFHYNVRGLMRNRKNSIATDIAKTAKREPEKFLQRNNGITLVCQRLDMFDETKFNLTGASLINGQQTIRALFTEWGNLDTLAKSRIQLSVKVISLNNATNEGLTEIVNIAKASNKQNAIKESDLFANDAVQSELEESAGLLPEPLRFQYVVKRTVQYPEEKNIVTRDEAILLLSIFVNGSPNDRLAGLYRYSYKSIFESSRSEHIALINNLKDVIQSKQAAHDANSAPGNKFWSERFYKRFKKSITVNYSLYIFSCMLGEKFNINTGELRRKLLTEIYDRMLKSSNYDIASYFNSDFWKAFQHTSFKLIKSYYDDSSATSNALRKDLDRTKLSELYDDFISEQAMSGPFNPDINRDR